MWGRLLLCFGLAITLCAPVNAAEVADRRALLSGANSWIFSGSGADDYLSLGLCSVGGTPIACASQFPNTRASQETCQWNDGHLTYAASTVDCVTDKGLATWESRTNSLTYSQTFSNVAWTTGGGWASTDNTALSPDNTLNASSVTTGAANNFVKQGFTDTALTTYTASVYIKPLTGTSGGSIYFTNTSTNDGCYVSTIQSGTTLSYLSTNALASGNCQGTGSVTYIGNGWYRVAVSGQTAGTQGGILISLVSSTFYAWGAQVEQGSFATPYIPTTSTTATRNADIITLPTNVLTDGRNTAETCTYSTGALAYVAANGICQTDLGVQYQPTSINLFLNNASLSTQSVTTLAQTYTASFYGTGSITFSGTYSGTLTGTGANNLVQTTFTPTAGTLTATVSGAVNSANLEPRVGATSPIVTAGSAAARANDFLQPLPTGVITTTRASTAYGSWADGHLSQFANLNPVLTDAGLQPVTAGVTNLQTYSQAFNNAAWTKANWTATDNAAFAPDLSYTADTITTGASIPSIYQTQTVTAGTPYTASVYILPLSTTTGSQIKFANAASSDGCLLNFNSTSTSITFSFLAAAASGTCYSYSITPVWGGWYRLSVTGATAAATSAGLAVYWQATTSSLEIWGAQLVAGTQPGVYTPTTSTSATTLADAFGSGSSVSDARNSAETCVNATTGAVTYAAVNTACPIASTGIVWPASTNLLLQSNFQSGWTSGAGATLTPNAVTSPDGTSNAASLSMTTASDYFYQTFTDTALTPYTGSLFVKPLTGSGTIVVSFANAASTDGCDFTITQVTTTLTVLSTTSEAAGKCVGSGALTGFSNGWYYVTVTGMTAGTTGGLKFYVSNYTSTFSVFGAQVELGTQATPLIPTTAAVASRLADAVYIPASNDVNTTRASAETCVDLSGAVTYVTAGNPCLVGGVIKPLPATTNLLQYSSALATSPWGNGNSATVTNNSTTSPDGTSNATLFTSGASNSYVYQAATVTASIPYTASVWAKPSVGTSAFSLYYGQNTTNYCQLAVNVTASSLVYSSTTAGGTGTCIGNGTVTAYSNGWYYLTVTGYSPSTNGQMTIQLGNSAITVYLFGAQVEAGLTATPVVPTTNAQASRSADVITQAAANPLDACLRTTPAAIYVQTNGMNNNGYTLSYNGGWLDYFSSTNANALFNGGAIATANPSTGTYASRAKVSFIYNGTTDKVVWGAGSSASGADSRSTATGTINIGDKSIGGHSLDGYLERLACFPNQYQLQSTYP